MRLILFGFVIRSKKSLRKIIADAIEKGVNEEQRVILHELIGIYNASVFVCIYPSFERWKGLKFFSNNSNPSKHDPKH